MRLLPEVWRKIGGVNTGYCHTHAVSLGFVATLQITIAERKPTAAEWEAHKLDQYKCAEVIPVRQHEHEQMYYVDLAGNRKELPF
jgi:hypothetical protein